MAGLRALMKAARHDGRLHAKQMLAVPAASQLLTCALCRHRRHHAPLPPPPPLSPRWVLLHLPQTWQAAGKLADLAVDVDFNAANISSTRLPITLSAKVGASGKRSCTHLAGQRSCVLVCQQSVAQHCLLARLVPVLMPAVHLMHGPPARLPHRRPHTQDVNLAGTAKTMWADAPAVVTNALKSVTFASLVSKMPDGEPH